MSDADRAHARHKSATPPRGVSIPVEIDPEVTPPPQAPPTLEGYSLSESVSILRAAAVEQAEAIERVWGARDLNDQVVTIGQNVAEIGALLKEFVMPAVKNMMGRLEFIERSQEANRGKSDRFWEHEWPTAIKTLEAVGQHMGRIEKDVDRLERNLDAYMKRSDEQAAQVRASLFELKAEDEKQEIRLRALEDFALTVKAKVALVSTLMGGGGAGIAWIVQHFLG